VFQSSRAVLADLRRRTAAGDPALSRVVTALRTDADAALTADPFTIVNKKHPLPGIDPHDYVSLARYFWPDPTKPDGLPYVSRDGEVNPEIYEYDAKPFADMSSHVYTLALAGYVIGEEKYSARAAQLIRVWFLDGRTKMNPNLDHAQLVKGQNLGRCYGIIESIRLLNVVDAVGILEQSSAWSKEDQAGMRGWFSRYADWMQHSKNGQEEATVTNNHGCWYDAQLATFLLFLGKDAEAKELIDAAKERRIAKQIEPGGEQPRELERTISFHYCAYNLAALMLLADLGDRVGAELWHYQTPDGRSIRAALDWMIPFATAEKKWTHQQVAGLEPQSLLVPLRRAEAALGDPRYETAVTRLGMDLSTSRDAFLFPAQTSRMRMPRRRQCPDPRPRSHRICGKRSGAVWQRRVRISLVANRSQRNCCQYSAGMSNASWSAPLAPAYSGSSTTVTRPPPILAMPSSTRLFRPSICPPPPESTMFWRSFSWNSGLKLATSFWIPSRIGGTRIMQASRISLVRS
jgi:hypothetical protein